MILSENAKAISQQDDTPKLLMEAVSNVRQLSTDHKPSCPSEFQRITEAGGYVSQTQTVMKDGYPTTFTQQVK